MGASRKSENTDKKPNRFLSVLKVALLLIAVIISSATLAVTAVIIIAYNSQTQASQEEYEPLRELVEDLEPEPPFISEFDAEMRSINPDYICWIKIEGSNVDYPVVRGDDNEKYLDLSFYGEENYLGALFMDYRCVGEFVPHIIIYGHNGRQGDLFGELWRFLDEQYMEENSIITLIVNDRIVEYEIFSARITTVFDPAYQLDFSVPGYFDNFLIRNSAPQDATQIITLSTCFGGDDKDERVLVQGTLLTDG